MPVVAANVYGGSRAQPYPSSGALECVQAKQRIIGRLIDGELGLLEAAARFRQVQMRSQPRSPVSLGPNPHDGEGVCRTVIGWACLALADRPEQADSVSERLESELQSHLSRFGRVNLPDVQ